MSTPSSSTSTLAGEDRPEAEPLPKKVGEIGYVAPPKSPEIVQQLQENEEPALPARHPADRSDEPAPSASAPAATSPTDGNTNTPNPPAAGEKSWRQRLTVGGVSLFSLFRVLVLLLFLVGTAAAWGLTIKVFGSFSDTPSTPTSQTSGGDDDFGPSASDNSDNGNGDGGSVPPSFSSIVIVHVSFTIVVLVELLFLERSIFHARAERYLYKRGVPRRGTSASMGITPWSRPSLPTYAAALAESGVRTGDAEDNLIAIPPPPAYGNTRGSVLLLSGFLRDSLIRNINRSSQQSTNNAPRPPTPREMEEGRASRPISYDASEEVDNARRARQLEEALSRLETGNQVRVHHTP